MKIEVTDGVLTATAESVSDAKKLLGMIKEAADSAKSNDTLICSCGFKAKTMRGLAIHNSMGHKIRSEKYAQNRTAYLERTKNTPMVFNHS
jgi:hypothetical protein